MNVQPETTYLALINLLKENEPEADFSVVEKAYKFAKEAHIAQKRATGEPYIIHPLATAMTLAEMHLPAPLSRREFFTMFRKTRREPSKTLKTNLDLKLHIS